MKTRRLLLFIALFSAASVKADIWQDPETKVNYEYTPGQPEACVLAGTEDFLASGSPDVKGTVVIKSSITIAGVTYTVTKIDELAFYDCDEMTAVEIPNSVKTIEGRAFLRCDGLTSVNIPQSVERIGTMAFSICEKLTSFVIPNSVISIGAAAFESTAWYESQPDGLLYKDNVLLDIKEEKPVGSVNVAEGTRMIAGGVFSFCYDITSISIPNTVKHIGEEAFMLCDKLEYVTLPNNLNVIEDELFMSCQSLKELTIPTSVTRIGKSAFRNCQSLTTLTIPEGVTEIGQWAFENCKQLKQITIPAAVTSLQGETFYHCDNLKEVTINSIGVLNVEHSSTHNYTHVFGEQVERYIVGAQITTLAPRTFIYCGKLKSVQLPNTVSVIGERAFQYCNSLETITLPDNLTEIGSYVFSGCSSLGNITFPSSLTTLGHMVFSECTTLTKMRIPPTITSFGDMIFYGCDNLVLTIDNEILSHEFSSSYNMGSIFGANIRGFILGNNVTAIGDNAFYRCYGMREVTIPSSVTSIGETAFYLCRKLSSIAIPDNVNTIGISAFRECEALTAVILPDGMTELANNVFLGCSALSTVKLPENLQAIRFGALWKCTSLSSIEIPETVSLIEGSVFLGCSSLNSIYCYAVEPPESERLNLPQISSAILHVPAGSVEAYQTAENWKTFGTIVGIGTNTQALASEVNASDMENSDLTNNTVNNVYYNVADGGYDQSDYSIVISEATDMSKIKDGTPGSNDVQSKFNGIIMKVNGRGTLTVNVMTLGDAELRVQIGNQAPVAVTKTERGDIVVNYAVDQETYAYIYTTVDKNSSAPAHRVAATTDVVKIYNLAMDAVVEDIDSKVHDIIVEQEATYSTLGGCRLQERPTQKGIYIVNGKKVVMK